jgi:hypothetical protein
VNPIRILFTIIFLFALSCLRSSAPAQTLDTGCMILKINTAACLDVDCTSCLQVGLSIPKIPGLWCYTFRCPEATKIFKTCKYQKGSPWCTATPMPAAPVKCVACVRLKCSVLKDGQCTACDCTFPAKSAKAVGFWVLWNKCAG